MISGAFSEEYKRNSFEWPEGTIRTKDGRPCQNVHNVVLALQSPDLDGLFTFDEMERKAKVTERLPDVFSDQEPRFKEYPYTFRDADCIHMQAWFQTLGMVNIGEKIVGRGIHLVSRYRSYHPVKTYLETLRWDGRRRLTRGCVAPSVSPSTDTTPPSAASSCCR